MVKAEFDAISLCPAMFYPDAGGFSHAVDL